MAIGRIMTVIEKSHKISTLQTLLSTHILAVDPERLPFHALASVSPTSQEQADDAWRFGRVSVIRESVCCAESICIPVPIAAHVNLQLNVHRLQYQHHNSHAIPQSSCKHNSSPLQHLGHIIYYISNMHQPTSFASSTKPLYNQPHTTYHVNLTIHICSTGTLGYCGGVANLSVPCLFNAIFAFRLSRFFFCIVRCNLQMANSSAGRFSHSFSRCL